MEIQPLTMTASEACARHIGLKQAELQKMCLKKMLKAKKVGRIWHILIADLDRVFVFGK